MKPPVPPGAPQPDFLKPFWSGLLGPAWFISLLVYAVLAAARFTAFLSPAPMQELYFLHTVAMWALPFIFLTAAGRREIGVSEFEARPVAIILSAVAGSICGVVFFALGMLIFGNSPDNWCVSIHNYLHLQELRGLIPPLGLFALYSLPAILLNPVGEEILFRGFIQQAFARRFSAAIGLIVNSLLFGLIYLSLHGIWHDGAGYHLRVASSAIAVTLMTGIGAVFTLCRTRGGSLWAAIAAHAGFNLTILGLAIYEFLG